MRACDHRNGRGVVGKNIGISSTSSSSFSSLLANCERFRAPRAERRDEMVSKQASFHARMVLNRGSDIQTFSLFFYFWRKREKETHLART
jgi:hypothetical protein